MFACAACTPSPSSHTTLTVMELLKAAFDTHTHTNTLTVMELLKAAFDTHTHTHTHTHTLTVMELLKAAFEEFKGGAPCLDHGFREVLCVRACVRARARVCASCVRGSVCVCARACVRAPRPKPLTTHLLVCPGHACTATSPRRVPPERT